MITKTYFLSGKKFKEPYFNITMKYCMLTNDIVTLNTINNRILRINSITETGVILSGNLHGKTAFYFNELKIVE